MRHPLPTRRLPARPNLDQLKRQAKELLNAFRAGAANAIAEVNDLLKSTPLGWACGWGREELVRAFLERSADPVEADAEPWATPFAWAEKKGHHKVTAMLQEYR